MGLVLLKHKTVRFLLVVAIVLGGFTLYGRLTGPGRIAPSLQAEMKRGGYVDIAVHLPFKPEQFHINLFQRIGTVKRVQGEVVSIGRVKTADVKRLSYNYWVRQITPLSSP